MFYNIQVNYSTAFKFIPNVKLDTLLINLINILKYILYFKMLIVKIDN